MTRSKRAETAKSQIHKTFNEKQEAFLNFVLDQYVSQGVGELDAEKLSPLLRLKYNNAIADAVKDLGRAEDINKMFSGFQAYLYQNTP